MNFTENKNNYYTKELNNIDRYLLRIVKRYFDLEEINSTASINAIITEAITRYKTSLTFDQSSVVSLNYKTGIVNLRIEDIKGERKFLKQSAFNKEFGNIQDTICMGNDERLYDKRIPTEHHHKINNINDLEKELDNLKTELDKYNYHIHYNKSILDKLRYTGTKTQVDLVKLESFGSTITVLLNILETKKYNLISIYKTNKPTIDNLLNQIYQFTQMTYNYIENNNDNINKLLIENINKKENEIKLIKDNIKNNYISSEQFSLVIQTINNTDLLIDTQEIAIQDLFQGEQTLTDTEGNTITDSEENTLMTIAYNTDNVIKDNVEQYQNINLSISDNVEIKSELVYNNTRTEMPYITEDLVISTGLSDNEIYLKIQPLKSEITIPEEILNSKIVIDIYSKKKIV